MKSSMTPLTKQIHMVGLADVPVVQAGDDIINIVLNGYAASSITPTDGDVVVIAQKVISKAERRTVKLEDIVPSDEAAKLGAQTGRDPRFCQLVLDESSSVLRIKGRVIVTKHRLGFECTSAGIDKSNVEPGTVSLLPIDPDGSANRIRHGIQALRKVAVAVIINDSFGRPDRDGSIGIAIGSAGIKPIDDTVLRDLFATELKPRVAVVDELAAAASLLMGQGGGGYPVVVIRGATYCRDDNAKLSDLLL